MLVQWYLLLASLGFVALGGYVHAVPRPPADVAFTQWLQAFNPPWFDALMRLVSLIGFDWKALAIIGLISSLIFLTGLRREAILGLIASTGIWLLDNAVKNLVDRPRPSPDLVHVVTQLDGPSFTSGHVTSFVVFYGYLWFLSYTNMRASWKRNLLLICFGALIAFIGISRVYTGEHWLTDVIGSYLLGSLWLAIIIYFYRLGRKRSAAAQTRISEVTLE
jgi:undecaprenyl-diphosphatase